ncbi:glycosyltransferase family A protein [Peribacillus frigoritolerans]|uniref:glycosyltransferase family A protein n=1 Tax=Peribacillus frigoritolerans TaxID=450367 RepID=UPI0007BEBCE4|nr:glycosyltransferase family A protein [Peribacillus frigoritolerans]MED4694899.1 glycosyltransferase family A protein [Peribacillus frigoritolerans]
MQLQVLLSAMHLKDYKFVDTLNVKTDCVVINQCDTNSVQLKSDKGREIKFISSTERGLSQSRNLALDNANAEICILCDNDVEYVPGYEKIILNKFKKYPDYDVIVFFINKNTGFSKPYFDKVKQLGYYSTLKVFSPEIAFRKKSLEENNIKFKTQFGAGAKYSMGEENIFLYDCLKKGLKILYVPMQIANLRDEESTWFKGFTPKYFVDRGAIFYEMSNAFSILFILQFAFRKHKLYKGEISMIDSIKFMLKGRKEYIKELADTRI